jgi:hypothetical protein
VNIILDWFIEVDLSKLLCQNEQTLLFGPSPEQWSLGKAFSLMTALIKLFGEWK